MHCIVHRAFFMIYLLQALKNLHDLGFHMTVAITGASKPHINLPIIKPTQVCLGGSWELFSCILN